MDSDSHTFASMPAPDFQDQDRQFARVFQIVEDGISARAFPAASLAVTYRGKLVAWRGFGRFTYDPLRR